MEKYPNKFNSENLTEDVSTILNLDSESNQDKSNEEIKIVASEPVIENYFDTSKETLIENYQESSRDIDQKISDIEELKDEEVVEEIDKRTELEKITDDFSEQNPDIPKEWIAVREMTGGYKVNILPNSAEAKGSVTSLNVPDNVKYLFVSGDLPNLINVNANNREDFKLIVNNTMSSVDVGSLNISKDLIVNCFNKEINLSGLGEVTNSIKIMGSVGNLDLSNLTQINNLDLSNSRGSESTQIKLNSSLDQEQINKFVEVFGTENIIIDNKENIEQANSVEEPSEQVEVVEEPKTELEKVTQELYTQNPDIPKEWIAVREMVGGYKVNILPNSAEAKGSVTSLNVPDNVKYLFVSGDLPNLSSIDANNREDFKLVINNINSSIDISSLNSSKNLIVNCANKEINLSGLGEVTNSIKIMGSVGNLDLSNLTQINNLDLSNSRGSESTQIKLNSSLDQEQINKFVEVFGTENIIIG